MLTQIVLALAAVVAVNADCTIDVNTDLPKSKSPLFIQDGAFVMPSVRGKTGVLEFAKDSKLTLACPGAKNTLTKTKQVVNEAVCSSGKMLKVGNKAAAMNTLGCERAAQASLQVTDVSCGNDNGTVVEMGFEVDGKWHSMVELCHQIDLGNTLWAKHTLHGAELPGAEVESKRPAFTRGDKALYKDYNPDSVYKQTAHKLMLEQALGKAMANKLMSMTYIARGHLAPDADFIFGSWQWLTYFYANVAPQWQSINAGNWLAVEKNTRKKASELAEDITVITGTQGMLSLPNAKGESTPLFLEAKLHKIPVPEWYWKVLYNPKSKEGVALVASNNPLLDSADNLICPNVCEENGWTTMTDFKKGLVYCCKVDDLRKAVPYLPAFKTKSVMQGPAPKANKSG